MCGRFTLSWSDYNKLAKELEVKVNETNAAAHQPRYNIAPTQQHWIVRMKSGARVMEPAHWGLINMWAKDRKRASRQINARSEKADSSPAYRVAFSRRRCVVPADGFYEWKGPKGKKQPVWFHAADGGLLRFAGLYEFWTDPETDETVTSFTILTTTPNTIAARVHNRMPVILDPDDVERWLSEEKLDKAAKTKLKEDLCVPAPDDLLDIRIVGKAVGNVRNHGPELLEPIDPPKGFEL